MPTLGMGPLGKARSRTRFVETAPDYPMAVSVSREGESIAGVRQSFGPLLFCVIFTELDSGEFDGAPKSAATYPVSSGIQPTRSCGCRSRDFRQARSRS